MIINRLGQVNPGPQCAKTKQSAQSLADAEKDLLSWLKGRDAEKIPDAARKVATELKSFASRLSNKNGAKQLEDFAAKITKYIDDRNSNLPQSTNLINQIHKSLSEELPKIFTSNNCK